MRIFEPARIDAPPSGPPSPGKIARSGSAPQPKRNLWLGPFGLRAGWGILLFFVTFGLLLSGSFYVFKHATKAGREAQSQYETDLRAREAAHGANPSRPAEPSLIRADKRIGSEIAQTSILLLTVAGLARLERRRFAVFGLGCFRLRNLLGGAATGLAALSLLAGALRVLHVLVFDARLLNVASALRSGLLWLLFFAIIGLFEEFLYRGYIQFTLTRGLLGVGRRLASQHPQRAAFWLAAVLWSLLFLSGHLGNPGETPSGLLAVFAAGLVFSYALWRTGSLWWAIGFHMAWDWSESFLYGVPDSGLVSAGRLFSTHPAGNPLLSGGAAGPEGSLLVLPTLLLVLLLLRRWPPGPLPFALPLLSPTEGASSDIVSAEPIP